MHNLGNIDEIKTWAVRGTDGFVTTWQVDAQGRTGTVHLPAMSADDTLVLADTAQTLKNKTLPIGEGNEVLGIDDTVAGYLNTVTSSVSAFMLTTATTLGTHTADILALQQRVTALEEGGGGGGGLSVVVSALETATGAASFGEDPQWLVIRKDYEGAAAVLVSDLVPEGSMLTLTNRNTGALSVALGLLNTVDLPAEQIPITLLEDETITMAMGADHAWTVTHQDRTVVLPPEVDEYATTTVAVGTGTTLTAGQVVEILPSGFVQVPGLVSTGSPSFSETTSYELTTVANTTDWHVLLEGATRSLLLTYGVNGTATSFLTASPYTPGATSVETDVIINDTSGSYWGTVGNEELFVATVRAGSGNNVASIYRVDKTTGAVTRTLDHDITGYGFGGTYYYGKASLALSDTKLVVASAGSCGVLTMSELGGTVSSSVYDDHGIGSYFPSLVKINDTAFLFMCDTGTKTRARVYDVGGSLVARSAYYELPDMPGAASTYITRGALINETTAFIARSAAVGASTSVSVGLLGSLDTTPELTNEVVIATGISGPGRTFAVAVNAGKGYVYLNKDDGQGVYTRQVLTINLSTLAVVATDDIPDQGEHDSFIMPGMAFLAGTPAVAQHGIRTPAVHFMALVVGDGSPQSRKFNYPPVGIVKANAVGPTTVEIYTGPLVPSTVAIPAGTELGVGFDGQVSATAAVAHVGTRVNDTEILLDLRNDLSLIEAEPTPEPAVPEWEDTVVVDFTTSGSWTVPANVYKLHLMAIGGGGGGAQPSNVIDFNSMGGNGGNSAIASVPVNPGDELTITIGAGGAVGAVDNSGVTGGATAVLRGMAALIGAAPGLGGWLAQVPKAVSSCHTNKPNEGLTNNTLGSPGLLYTFISGGDISIGGTASMHATHGAGGKGRDSAGDAAAGNAGYVRIEYTPGESKPT